MHGPHPSLVYYITGHGYGHGVRSCDIIRAFREQAPAVPVTLVTDLPEPFLRNRLGSPAPRIRPGRFDVGMVQRDSVRVDLEATLRELDDLRRNRQALLHQERAFLQEVGAGCVVCDIPALPLQAARRAGVPAVAVGNFSWDWIYRSMADRDPAWGVHADLFRSDYAAADLLLRLPFSDRMTAFRRQEQLPVVAEPGQADRARLASLTGADPARTWVLLSFTTLGLSPEAVERMSRLSEYAFFTVKPLAWDAPGFYPVDREDMGFSDVLAGCDAVLSKPGFGILSECVVNRKPLIYVDRTDFAEYAVLVEALQRYLQHVHIPADDLYAGRVEQALADIRTARPAPERLGGGGAPQAALRILDMM